MPSDALKPYRQKRNFTRTSEPFGTSAGDGMRFVVHKHHATADHYDLRLELDGVLKSWAVPKGPSLNPADKRFAVATEDHPIEYLDFEGVIPAGEYGGGPMIVWDTGTWAPMGDAAADLAKGAFKFRLAGQKLSGGWMLTRLKSRAEDDGKPGWLFFKEHDQSMDTTGDILVDRPESVKTGRRIEELVAPPVSRRSVQRPKPAKAQGARSAPMGEKLKLQLATAATEPPTSTANAPWLHEIKFDGYRTLAYLQAGVTRLITRGGLDWTSKYGDLPDAFGRLACREAIVDGEIVVLDEKGVSRFGLLQQALSEGAGQRLVFFAFDLLHLDGWDLRQVPLLARKTLLSQLIASSPAVGGAIQFSDHVEGDGTPLFSRAEELGLEGVVAKRADSLYVGGRSPSWLKVKVPRTGDFVIAGYTASDAAGGIGALVMAEWDGDVLKYRGKVGTGFDNSSMQDLLDRLEPLVTGELPEGAPKVSIGVRPILTARIRYTEITSDGLLRHAVFAGLREAALSKSNAAPRKRLITDADLAGIWVTNPTRRLFGKSGPTKLDIAVYYAAVGDFMLPHLLGRPVSLFRCPTGKSADCFFQRHPFTGMPATMQSVETTNGEGERQTFIAVRDTKSYLALAQFGAVEFHAWGTHVDHIDRPDRVIFDLDPGEGVEWRDVVNAAVHLRAELEGMGFVPFVKTSGGKGLHLVVPTTGRLTWKQAHVATSKIATALAKTGPDTFVTVMGASNRKNRIFIDFHRNARSATAVAAYSLRARTNLPASTPVEWHDLESIDSPEDLNYSTLPSLLTMSGDPWANINEFSRDLTA